MKRVCAIVFVLAACGDNGVAELPEVTEATAWVDPRIGTGGLGFNYGSCFVAAAAPHGFAKPGPDTNGRFMTANFQHYSGYFADDDRVQGFSSVHLHGTGATDYGVLSLMPTLAFDPQKASVVDYEAAFAKTDEHPSAGLYVVTLASGITVELTATPRVALHRYTLPAAGAVVIDLKKTLDSGNVDASSIAVDDGAHEITGQLHHLGGMSAGFGGYTLYFVMRGKWASHAMTANGAALMVPAGATTLAIGLSLVSIEGARKNLVAEVPEIDFDAVAAATRGAWEQRIGVVKLTGGTEVERRIFYTSLYHAFLMPSVIDDVDGSYQLAGQPVTKATDWHQMSDLSLWDTYRTVESLYTWLAPDSALNTARSLVGFGDGLGAYPRWPIAIGESGTMLGAPAEIVIADAIARGIPIDLSHAWPMLRAEAMDPVAPPGGRGERSNVDDYMKYGYVPLADNRSVSNTTELAHADFALATIASKFSPADHDALIARSHNWRTLYDPAVGFLRGKNIDGTFPTTALDPTKWNDEYAEADAWQSLWMVGAYDPDGLAQVMGGTDAVIAKLEMMFELTQHDFEIAGDGAANFPRPYYWAGNEPDLNAVYIFTQLGRADLAGKWLRWLEDTSYSDQPDGVPGNDDGGTMGAWYVLSTLGVYPVPGSDRWIIGAPLFPSARVVVGDHELVIDREGDGDLVDKLFVDGVPHDMPYLTHAELVAASSLHFVMHM